MIYQNSTRLLFSLLIAAGLQSCDGSKSNNTEDAPNPHHTQSYNATDTADQHQNDTDTPLALPSISLVIQLPSAFIGQQLSLSEGIISIYKGNQLLFKEAFNQNVIEIPVLDLPGPYTIIGQASIINLLPTNGSEGGRSPTNGSQGGKTTHTPILKPGDTIKFSGKILNNLTEKNIGNPIEVVFEGFEIIDR